MPRTTEVERILPTESIAEFLERSVYIRRVFRNGDGHRSWYEPSIYPMQVAVDVADYPWMNTSTEQEEPADGARYKFCLGRGLAESPFGGWQFIATAWRDGDVVLLEVEQD